MSLQSSVDSFGLVTSSYDRNNINKSRNGDFSSVLPKNQTSGSFLGSENESNKFKNTCGKDPSFITNIINQSGVRKQRALYMQLLGECLVSHCELRADDIIWAINYDQDNNYDLMSLSNERLAILTVHLCKSTDIGKYSLCFNFSVDRAIIRRDYRQFNSLLHIDFDDIFPELHNQKESFNDEEIKTLNEVYTLEYNAAYHLVVEMNELDLPLRQYLIHKCPVIESKEKLSLENTTQPSSNTVKSRSSPFSKGGVTIDGRRNVTTYKICYDKVCLMEEVNINMTTDLDDTVQVPDVLITGGETQLRTTVVHCMKAFDLVQALVTQQVIIKINNKKYLSAINPATQEPFDPEIYAMLKRRMTTEMKLYTYFIDRYRESVRSRTVEILP